MFAPTSGKLFLYFYFPILELLKSMTMFFSLIHMKLNYCKQESLQNMYGTLEIQCSQLSYMISVIFGHLITHSINSQAKNYYVGDHYQDGTYIPVNYITWWNKHQIMSMGYLSSNPVSCICSLDHVGNILFGTI